MRTMPNAEKDFFQKSRILSCFLFSTLILMTATPASASQYVAASQVFGGANSTFTGPESYARHLCTLPGGSNVSYERFEPWPDTPGNFNAYCRFVDDKVRPVPFSTFYKCPENTTQLFNEDRGLCRKNYSDDALNGGKPNSCEGNPVNVATGKKYEYAVDLMYTKSPLLSIRRSFTQNRWWFSFDRALVTPKKQIESWLPFAEIHEYTSSDGRLLTQAKFLSDSPGFKAMTFPATENREEYSTVTLENGTVEYFDSGPRIERIEATNGDTLEYVYDNANNTVTITSNRGDIALINYASIEVNGPNGETFNTRIYTDITVNGTTINYEYDAYGKLTRVIYEDNSTIEYQYTGDYLTGIIDENNHQRSTWTYNDKGLVASSMSAGGVDLHTFTYDRFDPSDYIGTASVTDSLGRVTNYAYQRIAGLRRITNVSGEESINCPA